MFLEHLLDYSDTIGVVLGQDPSYVKQLEKLKHTDPNKAYIGLYISKFTHQTGSSHVESYFRKSAGAIEPNSNQ